ncbi:hypothetical protein NCS56_01088000 [Fusarium sp. Ph1]|nr:hypothetical protein NCS56_01088000 [Fusarium sp. Ph1]
MNHQQEQLGRAVEAFAPQLRQVVEVFLPSPSMLVKAILAFLIVILMRFLLGYTLFAWVLIIIVAGDPKAEQLPFPYLVRRHSFNALIGNESWWDADRDRLKEKLVMSVNYSPFR